MHGTSAFVLEQFYHEQKPSKHALEHHEQKSRHDSELQFFANHSHIQSILVLLRDTKQAGICGLFLSQEKSPSTESNKSALLGNGKELVNHPSQFSLVPWAVLIAPYKIHP